VLLRTIDSLWVEHLTELDDMRRGIGLRGYSGTDPLNEFKREAFSLYEEFRGFIRHQVATTVFRVSVQRQEPPPPMTLPGPGQPARRAATGNGSAALSTGTGTGGTGAAVRTSVTTSTGTGGGAPVSNGAAAAGDGLAAAASANGHDAGDGANGAGTRAPGPGSAVLASTPGGQPLVAGVAGGAARPGTMRLQHGDEAVQAAATSTPGGPKLGRNDPCFCGSGLKYKKCHGR
jgi:preprotein translocase subunit SecA